MSFQPTDRTKEPRLDEEERQRIRQLFAPHKISYKITKRAYDILSLPRSKDEESVVPFC